MHEKKKTGPSEVEIRLFLSELPERPVHQDDAKGREGDYCVKAVERADAGLPGPIHADEEDRVVRCDCYEPIPEEGEPS